MPETASPTTTSDLTLGLDEAGRGPILGPMVMAAVALRPSQAARLTRLGVMDSKRFGASDDAHAVRGALADQIRALAAHWEISVVDVAEVDRRTRRGELNRLEQDYARRLIGRAPPLRRIVADGKRLFGPLAGMHARFDAVDHGEDAHVAVAAASVLAKVRRDELYRRIAARYRPAFGDIGGGGYVNAATTAFLRAFIERHGGIPPEGRRSWPWGFARDLLGEDFDPFAGEPDPATDEGSDNAPARRTARNRRGAPQLPLPF